MGAAPTFAMNRISRGLPGWTPPGFDYVIVGSGYGGSIAASKVARAGKTVCLLERGCEILPGSYPTDLASARDALQLVTARGGRLVPDKNAMMEVRVNDDVHVILGNGLGGGSLVNANVSIVPDMRMFNTGWPQFYAAAKTGEKDTKGKPFWMSKLTPFFAEVKQKLGAKTMPRTLNKLQALYQSSVAMKQDFELAEINITFDAGNNAFGFPQAACTMCGDCCSGCNYGAKNTLLMNYLPDAKAYGAVIVTEAEVDTVVKAGSGWTVSVYDRSKPFKDQKPIQIKAGTVILAAGSLGSTEILQRSTKAANGPSLSKALGTKFSANGDVLAFGFGANLPDSRQTPPPGLPQVPVPTELYSIGAGINAPVPSSPQFQPGPCITGIIRVDMDDDKPLKGGMVIEDGTAPGAFAALYPPLLFLQDVLTADPFAFPDAAARLKALQTLGEALQSGADPTPLSYTGIMTQMQSYLVMSHDDSSGKLVLDDTTDQAGGPPLASVSWAGAGSRAPYPRDNDKLAEAAGGIWADYIANPIWQSGFGRNIVSVHPLGGCPMADNDTDGVTDHLCRVYKGDGKNSVYPNLLVCDGSVVPTSLGVNPLLTISAIAALAIDALVGHVEMSKSDDRQSSLDASPEPIGALPEAGPDWPATSSEIGTARYAANVVSTSTSKGFAEFSLTAFGDTLVPDHDLEWAAFVKEFTEAVSLPDLCNGFTRITWDLKALEDATSSKSAPTIQSFLDRFFKVVGDVTPSLCFSESMRGAVSPRRASQDHAISNPYEIAEGIGKAAGQTLEADFTIRSQSKVVRDSKTGDIIPNVLGADLGGTVTLTQPDGTVTTYTVLQGTFDLFPPDPDKVETWCMKYHCLLQVVGATAPAWQMQGTKYLQNRPDSFWWTDLSTLYVDLDPVAATNSGQALQGIIRLDLQDIAAQVVSFKPDFNAIKLDQLKQNAIDAAKSGTFSDAVTKGTLRKDAFRVLLQYAKDSTDGLWPERFAKGLVEFYGAGVMGLFGNLILRTYGGYISYMEDFPAQTGDGTDGVFPPIGVQKDGWTCEQIPVPYGTEFDICLYHFVPAAPATVVKGPILLAPGMSTTARSFALLTNGEPSLVARLLAENYDVWLFDSRLAPPLDGQKTQTGYTLDDIAAQDWPLAVKYVLANSPLTAGKKNPTLQILAHCVGALTAQMALLGGYVDPAVVRQLILMQFTVHPAANWFNVVKSEPGLANGLAHGFPQPLVDLVQAEVSTDQWTALDHILTFGTPSINPRSTSPLSKDYQIPLDQIHNTIDWNAPFGIDHMCLSPTCHRIYGLYGSVIAHKNINEATHNALRQIFGDIATEPFEQLGLIMRRGRAVSSDGRDIYLPYYQRLDLPIHIISGTINQIVLPESGYYTQQWLIEKMPNSASKFTRTLIEGYAHNDCIIGKDANRDVFNGIMTVLDNYGRAKA